MEGVNRPDLLPKEDTPLIDVAGFLTPGEVPASVLLFSLCHIVHSQDRDFVVGHYI